MLHHCYFRDTVWCVASWLMILVYVWTHLSVLFLLYRRFWHFLHIFCNHRSNIWICTYISQIPLLNPALSHFGKKNSMANMFWDPLYFCRRGEKNICQILSQIHSQNVLGSRTTILKDSISAIAIGVWDCMF